MNYIFEFTNEFNRQIKHLHKRNAKLQSDLLAFFQSFNAEAHPVIPGAGGVRKARMRASGRGKSSSYRVIYYVQLGTRIWLLTIYDKTRKENLTESEKQQIEALIRDIEKAN